MRRKDQLPDNAILIARMMGPAALLDYDRKKLRGLMLEEGGPTSHVAIVARALGIPAVGEVENASGLVEAGDPIIVDGITGEVYLRPPPDIEAAYVERVKLRARKQAQYQTLRGRPCVTKDGHEIALHLNAGLLVDLPHIEETGAAGIGLFRTELQFMVATSFPRIGEQLALYRSVLETAGGKPVTFRTLDIGGDKVLPYMSAFEEENPALGWRAIRLGLDRPGLMRSQIRALLRAASGKALKIMFPMVAVVEEFDQGKEMVEHELTYLRRHGHTLAGAGRNRRDGGSAVAAVPARRPVAGGRFPVGRLERPVPVPVRRRPRQFAGRRALRPDLGAGGARAAPDRAQGARASQAGDAVRRTGLEADRRADAGRARLSLAVADARRRSDR